jgi:flagellar hook-length control protein FliK
MKESQSINLLKVPDIVPTHGISAGFIKELPVQGQSFGGILSEHLMNYKTDSAISNEDIGKKAVDLSLDRKEAGSNANYRLAENSDQKTERNNNLFYEETRTDNNIKAFKKNEPGTIEGKDNIQKEDKDKIGKNNSLKRKNHEDKREGLNADEISLLLKDVKIIFDMLKGLPPDKGVHELKFALFKLKNSLEPLNSQSDKKKFTVAYESEIKNLSEQLKQLLKSWNDRFEKGGISINKNIRNNTEQKKADSNESRDVKSEPVNLGEIKKQISKLTEEIKQYLSNKKPENTSTKKDEISNENKSTGSNKVIHEFLNAERSDGSSAKDYSSNYNFQNFRKESDGAGSLQKVNSSATSQRNNAFSEHLNDIVQNARIVVRDSRNGSFSIKLHPESLGRVNVNLNLEHGVIVGKFLVDTTEAKALMLENINSITDRLNEAGISVGEFHVNVRDENKPHFNDEYNTENYFYNSPSQAISAGLEYETNSLYAHNGEIDLVI